MEGGILMVRSSRRSFTAGIPRRVPGKFEPLANKKNGCLASPSSSMLRWLIALTLIALAGAGTYAVFHFFILTHMPHSMVGTWVIMDVKPKGTAKEDESLRGGRLEFRRDGTMIGKVKMDGKEGTMEATVEVEGEVLRITSEDQSTGQRVTDVQTIRTLLGDQLVIEDRNGTLFVMERLRE
jgi:hypothetical protein